MGLARVWNDHHTEYTEDFRGQKITIPAGKFVEMDQFDASAFMGQFIPPRRTNGGVCLNHKQLRLEMLPDQAAAKPVEHRCQLCRGLFQTENELILHSEKFHTDAIIKDESEGKKKAK